MCKRIHMIKVCENGSLVLAWPLSGPMNACLLLFCRSRHWQSLTRQWLSHQRKEPAADRANHIKRGCQGALLVNRGNKHLLIHTYSPAADTHRCAPSQCLHWEKMYCLDLIPLSLQPPPTPTPPPHQVVLVLTSSLPTHKGPLKCLRMLYGCMTRRRLTPLGVRKYIFCGWIHIVLLLVRGESHLN